MRVLRFDIVQNLCDYLVILTQKIMPEDMIWFKISLSV